MPKVLMVASEATPFAKTGGLADVIGSLPAALQAIGTEVAVLLPRYRGAALEGARRIYDHLQVWLGGTLYDSSVYQIGTYYFLDCPELYDRDGLYGTARGDYPDNHIRFGVLSRAALEVARRIFRPQVIHCHDWQSGMVAAYLRTALNGDPTFIGIKTLFTIHNLGYQGHFSSAVLDTTGIPLEVYHPAGLEFYGIVNLLNGGLVYSDYLTTVSKKYAEEIQTPEFGYALDGVVRSRADRVVGILNGVDYSVWNPEKDKLIAARYSAKDLTGKQACKKELLEIFGLSSEHESRPLLGIVSRFADQKGFDLIAAVANELMREDLTLIVLGTGERRYEELFEALANEFPGQVGVKIGYDNDLAHKIEAGSDMFLMPSSYEPCGLNQIYSLKYGTVPIVRATGGLDDTVESFDVEHGTGTGFKFASYSGAALLDAVRQALHLFTDERIWKRIQLNGMGKDFSWKRPAAEYAKLYKAARLARNQISVATSN